MTIPQLETVVVSRKTPDDGRLLITEALAERLAAIGPHLAVERDGELATARLHRMTCTCGKGTSGGAAHVHHFVESPLLTALIPGAEVALRLDEAGSVLSVERA